MVAIELTFPNEGKIWVAVHHITSLRQKKNSTAVTLSSNQTYHVEEPLNVIMNYISIATKNDRRFTEAR